MTENPALRAVLAAIADEAARNPSFLQQLERALVESRKRGPPKRLPGPVRGRRRRAKSTVDPFELVRTGGVERLRAELALLTLDQLRDVVAEYGIEPYTLAMKWKTPVRLIDLITETIEQRSRKGNAFR